MSRLTTDDLEADYRDMGAFRVKKKTVISMIEQCQAQGKHFKLFSIEHLTLDFMFDAMLQFDDQLHFS